MIERPPGLPGGLTEDPDSVVLSCGLHAGPASCVLLIFNFTPRAGMKARAWSQDQGVVRSGTLVVRTIVHGCRQRNPWGVIPTTDGVTVKALDPLARKTDWTRSVHETRALLSHLLELTWPRQKCSYHSKVWTHLISCLFFIFLPLLSMFTPSKYPPWL